VRFCKTQCARTDTFWGLSATAWTGITTLLTAGLLTVAVVAALYAKRQWDSAREQISEGRQAELEGRRPYVIVTVEPSIASRHLFDLVVRNIGQRPAEVVSIKLDPPAVSAVEEVGFKLSEAKMLTEPVAMIAPGQEMRAFYDSYIARNGRDDLPAFHKVSLSYQDSSGHKYAGTSIIDIQPMKGTTFTSVMTIDDIGRSLEGIQKTLSSASVLARQGNLDVEASVEPRAKQQERLAREQAEQKSKQDQLLRKMFPNSASSDETAESAPSSSADPEPDPV
jgi:hypothetical protein